MVYNGYSERGREPQEREVTVMRMSVNIFDPNRQQYIFHLPVEINSYMDNQDVWYLAQCIKADMPHNISSMFGDINILIDLITFAVMDGKSCIGWMTLDKEV